MSTGLVLWLWLAGGLGLGSPDDVSATLDRLGDVDLVLMNDPAGARPVRVLLATRVSAPVGRLRQVLTDSASYRKAMPAFRRTEIVSRRTRGAGITDLEIAWELEVPAWNLTGKLWLRPRPQGVDLEFSEGDFAPGLFHLKAIPSSSGDHKEEKPGAGEHSILIIDGSANLGDANWAMRKLVSHSPLVEPVMTVAAVYVMLRALTGLAERGAAARPDGAMTAPDLSSLQGSGTGRAASALTAQPRVFGAVRRRADGRLAQVEVAVPVAAAPEDAAGKSLRPEAFRALPGWKKVMPICGFPDECKDSVATCWAVETNVPLFSLGGTWKVAQQPWRARMVAGETKGAVLGLDFVSGPSKGRTTLVVSQHPRLDQAGYFPRKLIAAEPLLEHGLALALTIIEAVSLAPTLEGL
jgi:hypothetical protein